MVKGPQPQPTQVRGQVLEQMQFIRPEQKAVPSTRNKEQSRLSQPSNYQSREQDCVSHKFKYIWVPNPPFFFFFFFGKYPTTHKFMATVEIHGAMTFILVILKKFCQ